MTKPNGRGLKRAQKKLKRLKSRGVRGRAIRRQSERVSRLLTNYTKRLLKMREERTAAEQEATS